MKTQQLPINILLADDDEDDCLLFNEALAMLQLPVNLTVVNNGEALMRYFKTIQANLPQVLFLDLNMPRKNGVECLVEIKTNSTLKDLPVIIFSTSYNQTTANMLQQAGALYYLRKPTDFEELKSAIHKAILLVSSNNLSAEKHDFYLNKHKAFL